MGVGAAIDKARTKLAAKADKILPDLCTITVPGAATTDEYNEEVAGAPSTTANVPVRYEPLSAYERAVASTVAAGADYKLKFPVVWDGAALVVAKDSTVAVESRGLNPARTFNVKAPLPSSDEVWLYVAATLKQ